MERKIEKKRMRDELESRHVLQIKRNKEEMIKKRDKKMEESLDVRMLSQHCSSNNVVFFLSLSQVDDSKEEDERQFRAFVEQNNFGYLKKPVSDKLKITIIQHGPKKYQNKGSTFAKKDGRSLCQHWFYKVPTNGKIAARKRVVVLSISGSMLLFRTFLFLKKQLPSSFSKEEGFCTKENRIQE